MLPCYVKFHAHDDREEDVSKTMYRETQRNTAEIPEQHQSTSIESKSLKVNRICNAFLDALEGLTSSHSQNIITAHVCKNPPDLDAGLAQIARLRSGCSSPKYKYGIPLMYGRQESQLSERSD